MKNIVEKTKKLILADDSGSAIVIVIIALAFVGILGTTMMWMSLSNYRIKVTDQDNKQSFYSAEEVFDQIQIGLQSDASVAADYAWSYVMQNYNSLPTDDAKQSEFIKEYKKNLINILTDGSVSSGKYNLNHISSYVDPSINISTDSLNKGDPIRYLGTIKADGTEGNASDAEIINSTNDYILLKNFLLEYTDDSEFYSVISTDIMISSPRVTFTESSNLPELFKFALIGNEGVEVTTAPLTVVGSIYAGGYGLSCNNAVKISKAKYVVSNGLVDLKNSAADFTINAYLDDNNLTHFYSEGIEINGSKLEVEANTRVADDLTLNGNNSRAILKGTYAGYGYSTVSSNSSSAIVINGLKSGINMSGLNSALLAGHSFIGTSKAKEIDTLPENFNEAYTDQNVDVPMGESISVKGNQLAYLVPEECIGVLNNKTVVGKNPMTGAEYSEMLSKYHYNPATGTWDSGFELVSFSKSISALDGQRLGNYTTNIKTVFAPSNGETLVYYYMIFDNPDDANSYFKDYYAKNNDRMKAYFDVYATQGVSMPEASKANIQGTYVTGTMTASQINNPHKVDDTKLVELCRNYSEISAALNAKLVVNYSGLKDEERNNSVYENIIDTTKFNSMITSTKVFSTSTGCKAVMTNGDYTYTGADSKIRMIVAKGNVTVEGHFTGLIIAGGSVIEGSDITITSADNGTAGEKSELISVLQQELDIDGLGTMVRPIDFFKDGSSIIIGGSSSGNVSSKGQTDLTDLIKYQNWVKR